jgi:hypothetical protein
LAIPLILEDVKAGNEEMADVVRTVVSYVLYTLHDKVIKDIKIEDMSKLTTWTDNTVPMFNDKEKWDAWIAENENKYIKIKEEVLKIK